MDLEQEGMGQYVLLGKTGANEWLPILLIYPELQDYSFKFDTLIEAQGAKRDLKNYLKVYKPHDKVPLKITQLNAVS
jgi:hypothetical protein